MPGADADLRLVLTTARRAGVREPLTALAVCTMAALAALLAQRSLLLALAVALLPALVMLATRPVLSAVLGVSLLSLTTNVAPGLPLQVSFTDSFMLLAAVVSLPLLTRGTQRQLRPLLWLVAVYALCLLPSLVTGLDVAAVVTGLQRLQIVLVPAVVAVLLVRRSALPWALSLYVAVSSVVGVLFGAGLLPESLQLQKNPVGQFVAGAVLVVAAGQAARWQVVLCLPLLAYGLFASESRGAILGLLLGFAALVAARPGAARLRTAAVLIPVLLLLGLAFQALPDEVQQRTTTLVAEEEQPDPSDGGEYTIRIREAYREDAERLIRENPVTGVGLGNYLTGNESDGTLTIDPHNVLYLEAAEGGLPLLGGFLVLTVGSCAVVWRQRRKTALAPLAFAVQLSTVSHALVDIYWVRGTPVLGWLLVAAVLVTSHRREEPA